MHGPSGGGRPPITCSALLGLGPWRCCAPAGQPGKTKAHRASVYKSAATCLARLPAAHAGGWRSGSSGAQHLMSGHVPSTSSSQRLRPGLGRGGPPASAHHAGRLTRGAVKSGPSSMWLGSWLMSLTEGSCGATLRLRAPGLSPPAPMPSLPSRLLTLRLWRCPMAAWALGCRIAASGSLAVRLS
ncbi:MAG: hypothetical protein J3K34DRAFT_411528 [Monoraphidium minutum]|nr:MAG: hypothetical protein J3K34DRAFT_411528 [Monoraphidium minutum]